MKIAVVGSGVAGLVAARQLAREHEVVLFEAEQRPGGHVHTHELRQGTRGFAVDSGFIVFNDWTYPRFMALLAELGVESQPTSMSFSVRVAATGLEYNGTSLDTLFAQRRNLLRPAFWRMLRDILRFNREAPALLAPDERGGSDGSDGTDGRRAPSLGEYLAEHRYTREFTDYYIVPMGAAIWSTDPARLLQFPAPFFVRFFHNHGMLSIDARPQWRVVRGGSARYVRRLLEAFRGELRLGCPVRAVSRPAGAVLVRSAAGEAERFDAVFLACHADQALALLADADPLEREVLGSFPYQANEAVLHTDTRLLPRAPRARAAWNYYVPERDRGRVVLTYDMNVLQSLDAQPPFLVTLNHLDAIAPEHVRARMRYAHPLFTPEAVAAQARQRELNGRRHSYFCGAYWRFGFHEDGVVSAQEACAHFAADLERARGVAAWSGRRSA